MTTADKLATAYNTAQAKVSRLWNLMCIADGIDPHSKFVVFADANPHAIEYNEAMMDFQNIRRQIQKFNNRKRAVA